jgi:hypothetical protein
MPVVTINGLGQSVTDYPLTFPPSTPYYDPSTGVMILPTGQIIQTGAPAETTSTVPQQTIPFPTDCSSYVQDVPGGPLRCVGLPRVSTWPSNLPPPQTPTYTYDWGHIAIAGAGALLLLGLLLGPRR